MAVLPSNQHVLTVQRLGKKDFGEYVCRATNDLGSARGSAYIRESWPSGDQCKVKNIPVMNNFNDQKVRKEVIRKIVLSAKIIDDEKECPRDRVHVEIVSRDQVIPEDVLSELYTYVAKACVPVSSLIDAVPVPRDFDVSGVTGTWHLVATARPDSNSAPYRSSVRILASGGDVIIFFRTYNTTSDLCGPVNVDVLHSSTSAGRYTYGFGDITGVAAPSIDGTCRPDSQLVEVFSRSANVSGDRLRVLKQPVANACVDIAKLQRTGSGNCSTPESVVSGVILEDIKTDRGSIGCRRDLVAIADGFSDEQFLGRWHTVYRTTFDIREVREFSKITQAVKTPDGRFQLMIRYHNSTERRRCPPTEVLQLFQESTPGDYTFVYHSNKGAFKVLYMDDEVAVVYWCHRFLQNNQCSTSSLLVEILARDGKSSISGDKLHLLQQHIVNVCVDLQHVKRTAEDPLCTIPARVQEVVEAGEITSAYDIPAFACDGQLLRGTKDIDLQDRGLSQLVSKGGRIFVQLSGEWMVLWRTPSFLEQHPPESESFFIIPKLTGILTLWRSYDNELNMCKPTEAGMLESTSGSGDYYYTFDESPDYFTIGCRKDLIKGQHGVTDDMDDTCDPETQDFFVLSRRRAQVEVSEDLKYNMTVLAAEACIAADSLRELSEDYMKVQCQMRYIPVQENFNLREFAGAWYSHWDTQTVGGRNTLMSPAYYMVVRQDGTTLLLNTSLNPFTHTCMPTRLIRLNPGSKPGSFTFAQLKVVWTDYEQAVMYWCINVLPNDMCDGRQVHVSVWSRREELMFTLPFDLLDFIADTCVSRDDFISTSSGRSRVSLLRCTCGCECAWFSGAWHTVRQTKFMWGNNTWDSVVRKFVIGADGDVSIAYTGYEGGMFG
ncbi:hypothetical protein C0Q70_17457 [Pomacea canaliculata]|uniref:Ig-like domain-containing protein n=1 Tax=Pomacea canaliculata TaxID=400727 RepID=A0A2T7NKG3_POMCA|nr:hypothetical protein C0Q70_17457 [Pomacea canaliculata]